MPWPTSECWDGGPGARAHTSPAPAPPGPLSSTPVPSLASAVSPRLPPPQQSGSRGTLPARAQNEKEISCVGLAFFTRVPAASYSALLFLSSSPPSPTPVLMRKKVIANRRLILSLCSPSVYPGPPPVLLFSLVSGFDKTDDIYAFQKLQ